MTIIQSILGLGIFCFFAYLLSENKKSVSFKLLGLGVTLQIFMAFILIKVPFIKGLFLNLNQIVLMIEKATISGASFMFGYLAGGALPFSEVTTGASFIVAFRILPILLVVSAISAVLFHWGVLPFIVRLISLALQKTFKISGVQGLGVASNIFLGMVESTLFVRPYLRDMSRSTLFMLMTAGMSTVAGTVMVLYASVLSQIIDDSLGHILIASLISAPAAIILSLTIVPGKEEEEAQIVSFKRETTGTMDALVKGSMEGIELLLAVIAMVIVLFACVHLTNQLLAFLPFVDGAPITIEKIVSYPFRPIMWFIGIEWSETKLAAELMGTKTILNEFVSYQKMAMLKEGALSQRAQLILLYAMCGFANLTSLGLVVGSLGSLVPERRAEVASLGMKSVLSGTLATCMTGAVVSFFL